MLKELFHDSANVVGLYPDGTTDEQYYGDRTRDSHSSVECYRRSPFEYKERYIDNKKEESAAHFKFGNMVHCALFEPDEFIKRYILLPRKYDRRKPADKEEHDGLVATAKANNMEVVSPEESELITAMVKACHTNEEFKRIISYPLVHEIPLRWTHEDTGLKMRSKIDTVAIGPPEDGRIYVLDVKTTADETIREICNSIWNYGYFRQQAVYTEALRQTMKINSEEFFARLDFRFVFVTKKNPEAVVMRLTEDYVIRGWEMVNQTIAELAIAKDFGIRPRWTNEVIDVDLPEFARKKD